MTDFSEQQKTMQHALTILDKTKRCCIIRPTGFGKTYILTELISRFKKVLYLYPAEVIRNTVVDRYYESMYDSEIDDYIDENGNVIDPETIDTYKALKQIDNCDLMTYAKLIRLTDDELKAMKYDLILFDECHRLGGFKTKIAVIP
jgi:superfamily II DNA or RNA helicase